MPFGHRSPLPYGRVPSPAATRRIPDGTGVWAVVVGIDDCPGTDRDFRAAVADTTQATALLDRIGSPPAQRRVLLDGQAFPLRRRLSCETS